MPNEPVELDVPQVIADVSGFEPPLIVAVRVIMLFPLIEVSAVVTVKLVAVCASAGAAISQIAAATQISSAVARMNEIIFLFKGISTWIFLP